MSLLVMDPGLAALFAMGLAGYVGYVVELPPLGLKLVALATVLVVALINCLGVRLGAWLVRGLTALKLGVLVFLAAWGFGLGLGDWSNFTPFIERPDDSGPLGSAIVGGLISAFFAFGGWWDMSKMAGEMRDPGRTLPRALVLGVAIVTAAYLLVSAVFLYLVPVGQVTSNQTFVAQAGEVLFGRVGGVLLSGIVILVVLGSLASIVMNSPRVYYAMARDALFVPGIAAIHPRFGTPARAIALQAVLACVLICTGTFEEILSYFFFVAVAFAGLTIATIYVLRRSAPGHALYRTPGYPLTPLLFIFPLALVLVLLALDSPLRAGVGVAIVVLGLPVYQILVRRRSRRLEQ
jgi:APA family basic amino acid/polyamine antiporter